jgi:VWFA-related protein
MKRTCSLLAACVLLAPACAQEPVDSHTVLRSDTRLVLVDTVVTDKKGAYVRDLSQKDFKVYEDNKEQTITSFSFETDAAKVDGNHKHYLVLFFDNSTAGPQQQVYAREAATKFITANAGPNRLIAIAEFGGTLRITQNFTEDADRLKKVVSGVKFASMGSAAGGMGGNRRMNAAFNDFSIRGVLGALRNMAKGLAEVPGRKTLIFLSGGFPMTNDTITELTATIDACNRANVAVYPIDVRGLVATPIGELRRSPAPSSMPTGFGGLGGFAMGFQTRGGGTPPAGGGAGAGSSGGGSTGGGAGGGSAGAGAGGGRSGGFGTTGGGSTGGGGRAGGPGSPTVGTNGGNNSGNNGRGNNNPGNSGGGFNDPNRNNNFNRDPMNPANRANSLRNIMPPIDTSITGLQQVLYALASGTGGFVIANTNDLLGGLEKIGREQNEYYLIGYAPSKDAEPGACHTLRVKVSKGGSVRSRSGYCESKSLDILSGTPAERDLEARIKGNAPSTVQGASMQTPFFYISANTARVNLVLEVPAGTLQFSKEKGKFRSTTNVVGIAYLADGSVAARFSDSVKMVFEEKKEVEAFEKRPFHYEKQFEMAPGSYNLKLVFSSAADQLGKLENTLHIDPWETNQFFISSLAMSKSIRPAAQSTGAFDPELLENRVPLVVGKLQVMPTGFTHFKKSDKSYVYAEVYEPALAVPDVQQKDVPVVAVQMELLDPKSGAVKKDFGVMRLDTPQATGSPAIPVGLVITAPELDPGLYRLRITAVDANKHQVARSAGIILE